MNKRFATVNLSLFLGFRSQQFGPPVVGLRVAGVSPARSEGILPSPPKDLHCMTSIDRPLRTPFVSLFRLAPGFVEVDQIAPRLQCMRVRVTEFETAAFEGFN